MMSRFGAAIILAFSRDAGAGDLHTDGTDWSGDALSLLKECYPSLSEWVHGKTVLDFGCGYGFQSIALRQMGAQRVVGLDTNPSAIESGMKLAGSSGLGRDVTFTDSLPPELLHTFDIVISQNAMEHFPDPEGALGLMASALKPDGRLLVTFGPPWFSPYGSHMHFFTKIPWVNLFFSEDSVMRARGRFRKDGAMRYVDVESGLNRMSVGKFERLLDSCDLKTEFAHYRCVKGLNFINRMPLLRELFVNHITVSARRASRP